jgi:hypothetical protein
LFRVDDRRDRRIGRRWRLYDDLGNMSEPADYVRPPLDETIGPARGTRDIGASDDGTVWV